MFQTSPSEFAVAYPEHLLCAWQLACGFFLFAPSSTGPWKTILCAIQLVLLSLTMIIFHQPTPSQRVDQRVRVRREWIVCPRRCGKANHARLRGARRPHPQLMDHRSGERDSALPVRAH